MEDDNASIPTEHERSGPHLSAGTCKAAKHTFAWDLSSKEIQLALPRPQYEYIQETKRPRLETPFPTSTYEATTNNTSHATTVALRPTDTAADRDDSDPVTDMHSNASTTGASRHWTPEESAELTCAVAKTRKKWMGKDYKIDWIAIASLVPGRTRRQCYRRWHDAVNPITLMAGRKGKWAEDEDIKLKTAVHIHGGKSWDEIAVLVPGRTHKQCQTRWHRVLVDSDVRMATGTWNTDESDKLKNVRIHDGKGWEAIAHLVPGRTREQCRDKWKRFSGP
jgi:hypothetical protein